MPTSRTEAQAGFTLLELLAVLVILALAAFGVAWYLTDGDLAALPQRHQELTPRWLAFVQELDRRGGWDDRLIDALCDPPESFVMSSVVAHVLTFAAHRRQLVRQMLAEAGVETDSGDPILWFRARRGEEMSR